MSNEFYISTNTLPFKSTLNKSELRDCLLIDVASTTFKTGISIVYFKMICPDNGKIKLALYVNLLSLSAIKCLATQNCMSWDLHPLGHHHT